MRNRRLKWLDDGEVSAALSVAIFTNDEYQYFGYVIPYLNTLGPITSLV